MPRITIEWDDDDVPRESALRRWWGALNDPSDGSAEEFGPVNEVERPESAARRYAAQLTDLSNGLLAAGYGAEMRDLPEDHVVPFALDIIGRASRPYG